MDTKIAIFRNKKVRKTIFQNEWWFSVVDVIFALTDSVDPKDYWYKMKVRVKSEDGVELSTVCRQLKLEAADGKKYLTDCANTEGIFRIIQSIPSPKEIRSCYNGLMKILLIGPQGSGKSTQGKMLSEHLQVPYISTGDIFRQMSSEDSEEGKRIKQIIDAGSLVDDQLVSQLLQKRIKQADCQNGFILDGYPRNLEQAKLIPDLNFDKVLYINVPEDMVVERLLKRGRADDTKDSIKLRLELYFSQTQPLLDYYRSQGMLIEIDGTGDIQTVQHEITKSL